MRAVNLFVGVVLTFIVSACSQGQRLHIRGELDRTNWIVRLCDSADFYGVVMTSAHWARILDYEKQNGISHADPLLIEFDGTTVPRIWPWDTHEKVVGVEGPMKLERGTCK